MTTENTTGTSIYYRLRAAGREELVHYAGAAHRDEVAAQMIREWQADPAADEATLKSRALKVVHNWDIPDEQIRVILRR